MDTIGSYDKQEQQQTKGPGFWQRQFKQQATLAQLVCDIIFGVVGPVLCFVFDPIAFRGDFPGGPLFAAYAAFVYLVSALEIATLVLWLTLGRGLPGKRLIGGVLIAGGVLCFVIGCLLFPFSMLGLVFYGVGILGFTPFLTAIVYLRNGYRAVRSEHTEVAGVGRTAPILIGCLVAMSAPALLSTVLHRAIAQSVNEIVEGNPQQSQAASGTLKWLRPLTGAELDRIVNVYASEKDPLRRERLRKAYFEITGEDIETRLHRFQD